MLKVKCINNDGYVDLKINNLYEVISPPKEENTLLLIIDESGEDYFYPKKLFEELNEN